MTIYFSQRASREGWVSFETDPRLRHTKDRLYSRCLPCLTSLLEQLREGAGSVRLEAAWECWKVVAVLPERDPCLELLSRFGEAYPDEYVFGKLGTGNGRETVAVMFHTEDLQRRDRLHELLAKVAAEHFPAARVFCSRACSDPYERLLGPWESWRQTCPIRHPERLAAVKASLRESLYGRG
jgi:hypothetical protein